MKKISLLTLMLALSLVTFNCSNDDEIKLVETNNSKTSLAIDNYVGFVSGLENESTNLTNARYSGKNYFDKINESLEVLPEETIVTKDVLILATEEIYIEGTYEFFESVDYLAKEVKNNVVNDTMTEDEKLSAVVNYLTINDTAYKADASGMGIGGASDNCKRRERNCHILVTGTAILRHLGCVAVADSTTVATWGSTSMFSVLCHSTVAAMHAAGTSNCIMDYEECIQN